MGYIQSWNQIRHCLFRRFKLINGEVSGGRRPGEPSLVCNGSAGGY